MANRIKLPLSVAVGEMSFLTDAAAYKVWIFAPFLETDDPTLKFYYDYTQSIAEYTKVFSEINCE